MNLIKTSGIHLPKTHKRYEEIVSNLTRKIFNYMDNTHKELQFFYDKGDYILIPRYYPLEEDNIIDNSVLGADIEINSTLVPRGKDQENAIKYLSENTNCILKRFTGGGKSAIAIASICNIKKRAIIIVNQDELLDNWRKEFFLHTDIKEDQIDKINSKNYEECLQKSIILSTPQLLSGCLQNSDFSSALENSNIGVMVVDEVHRSVGPERFSLCSAYIKAKRTYGLSATPARNDGCTDIIHYHLGPLIEFGNSENEVINPDIYMKYFDHETYTPHRKYIMWQGKFIHQRYVQQLKKSKRFMDVIIPDILKAFNNNRNILIMASRKDILIEIVKALKLDKEHIGMFIPTLNKKERLLYSDTSDLKIAFHEKRVVVGTFSGAREGHSRKDFDCLFFASSTPEAEQAVGRVIRSLDGKRTPIVVDYVDTDPNAFQKSTYRPGDKTVFMKQAEKRETFYQSKDWKINKIFMR